MIGCRHHGTSVSGFRRGRPNNPASFGRWTCSRTADDPAATEAAFSNGWLDSGDVMRVDDDGYFLFRGRKKQIIVHDGSNISPFEVEGALLEHPAVALVGVVGVHDAVHGETVRAYITLREDAVRPTRAELIVFARERDDRCVQRLIVEEREERDEFGVEIEVNPAGKSTRKLSLMSGGEKSLVALAFVFAVFLARPCPFYILDEVEAALDDANIDRFLQLIRRFSDRAQFVIVTHQKRTMDAADVLYGVSMGGDGVTKVVSRRLPREAAEDAEDDAPGLSAVA